MGVILAAQPDTERAIRMDLAALYRLFHHFGWTDLTYTHLTARVPGEPPSYLINRYGHLFDEVSASSLLRVEMDGGTQTGRRPFNLAGHVIHTALLRARPDINYFLHSHTRAGAAVASLKCGLLPLSQPALAVLGTLKYHPYNVAEENAEEGARVAADLADGYAMLLQNHGMLVCGRTAAEAFLYHYFLQSACEIQLEILASGADYVTPSDEAASKLSAWGAPRTTPWGDRPWEALIRLLDRTDSSYRN